MMPSLESKESASGAFQVLIFAALVFVAGCRSGALLRATDPTDLVIEANGFRVISPGGDSDFGEEIMRVTEAVVPIAAQLFTVPVWPDGERVRGTAYLYPTVAEFLHYEGKLTRGKFAKNRAFSHAATRSAHLVVLPISTPEQLARFGLPFHTLRGLAHELSHLFVFEHTGGHSLPSWLAEGTATWIEAQVMLELGHIETLESEPWSSTYMFKAQQLLASQMLPSLRQVVESEHEGLPASEVYALRYLAFRFLHEHSPTAIDRIFQLAFHSRDGRYDLERLETQAVGILEEHASWTELNLQFQEFVEGLNPEWNERARSLHFGKAGGRQAGIEDSSALVWRVERLTEREFSLEGALEFLGDHASLAHLYIEERESAAHLFEFSGTGRARYFRKPGELEQSGEWELVAESESSVPLVEGDAPKFELIIDVGRCELQFAAGARIVVEVELDLVGGRWGLGAPKGQTAHWRELLVNRAKP